MLNETDKSFHPVTLKVKEQPPKGRRLRGDLKENGGGEVGQHFKAGRFQLVLKCAAVHIILNLYITNFI